MERRVLSFDSVAWFYAVKYVKEYVSSYHYLSINKLINNVIKIKFLLEKSSVILEDYNITNKYSEVPLCLHFKIIVNTLNTLYMYLNTCKIIILNIMVIQLPSRQSTPINISINDNLQIHALDTSTWCSFPKFYMFSFLIIYIEYGEFRTKNIIRRRSK